MNPIPFFSTQREHKDLEPLLLQNCREVLLSGNSLQGPPVEIFELQMSKFSGRKYAVAVGSCTDALYFALKSLHIEPGDEVIVPAFSFIASASCILRANATPIFADVDVNGNLDINVIERLITSKTKAIIYVHMFGLIDNYSSISAIAKNNNLFLIEDSAQAFGASYSQKRAGSLGDVSCYSFDPTKILSAPGSGGMLLTDSEEIAQLARRYRYHGKSPSKQFDTLGFNSQMPSLTAAILSTKLKYEGINKEKRIEIAHNYIDQLQHLDILLPPKSNNGSHVYHKFVIQSKKRDSLFKYLQNSGIQTMIHYENTIPDMPAFNKYRNETTNRATAINLTKSSVSLPIHSYLEEHEVAKIISTIKEFHSKI